MSDELDKVQQEAKRVQKELNENGLSRRGLVNRFSFMGLGFGPPTCSAPSAPTL